MMSQGAFFDPRLLVAAPKPSRHARRGSTEETQEVAGFLLQLKHRSVTPEPPVCASIQVDSPERRLPVARRQPQTAQLRELPVSYPSVGTVYGLPPVGFKQPLVDRTPPSLMEEPSLSEGSWEVLLGDSDLVLMKDRDLVPDALFVAMAQMKPCKLTQADRVGCYKSREIGFTGMCCKHCGGQPGFGRYYPNSVRSLAQTTTSQTILKHIANKCRFCPPHVRQAVMELQRQQAVKEGMASGRPRYGSRKIFFQRMWARLHGNNSYGEDDDDSKVAEDESHASGSYGDHQSPDHSDADSDEEDYELPKNHNRRLPIQKRKLDLEEHESKRPRVVGI